MTQEAVGWDEVAPDASAMLESMRATGYTLSTAVADLIDNCIAADAKNVWLRFQWAGSDTWATIRDDGHGMSESELVEAMCLGSKNPLDAREPRDLGRFGLGLKTASLSQCRRLTVASRRSDQPLCIRRWDLDYLRRQDVIGWRLLRKAHDGSVGHARLPEAQSHGTIVLWESLDRVVGNADKDDQRRQNHFLRSVEQVEQHLAMVFHRYLAGSRRRLRIFLNDRAISAWDPFLEGHPATNPSPLERIALEGHEPVEVRGFILPHKDKLGDVLHRSASGPAGWNAQQGFYLYRNERLILAGSWLGLGGARPWTKEEHYKLARIRLDIPNSMDHEWQLDVKKSSAQPPAVIQERLRGLAQTIRSNARQVFAHRGKYGKRTKKEELQRPWKVVRRSGMIRYRIDRKHPLLSGLTATLPPTERKDLERVLRVIEETVPIEQIWLDSAENPDRNTRPFVGTTSRQLSDLIAGAYRAIRRQRGLTHDEAVAALLEWEEFSDAEARSVIGVLQEAT